MLTLCQTSLFSRFRKKTGDANTPAATSILPRAMGFRAGFMVLAVLLLSACGSTGSANFPKSADDARADKYGRIQDNVGDEGGFTLWDSGSRKGGAGEGSLAVNTYLWRAALDTVSFMPIASADSNGGVVLTDWYTPQSTPNERLKLNILIKDKTLRADGVKVTVFRQAADRNGNWRDTNVSPDTAAQLEDTIVARARQLRLQNEGKAN